MKIEQKNRFRQKINFLEFPLYTTNFNPSRFWLVYEAQDAERYYIYIINYKIFI